MGEGCGPGQPGSQRTIASCLLTSEICPQAASVGRGPESTAVGNKSYRPHPGWDAGETWHGCEVQQHQLGGSGRVSANTWPGHLSEPTDSFENADATVLRPEIRPTCPQGGKSGQQKSHRPQHSHVLTGERKVTGQDPGKRSGAGRPHARAISPWALAGAGRGQRHSAGRALLDSCSCRDPPTSKGEPAGDRVISAHLYPQLH